MLTSADVDVLLFSGCATKMQFLSQCQIDVNPIFIFNQNASSVRRHVQRQPDLT